MSTTLAVLLGLLGIVMLGAGAHWLVEGSSRLALKLGMSPMVVGITVVGFGTSMPEFSVSVLAAARDQAGISIGNAVGSNVMNLLLVLGAAAIIAPIHIVGSKSRTLRDLVFGLVPAAILVAAAFDGRLERGWALALLAVFAFFIVSCLREDRRTGEPHSEAEVVTRGPMTRDLVETVVGIVILVSGADLLVRGGVVVAQGLGVSDAVIGLTLVAFGTSLPELATSVVAALKGEVELSVGNVLGSNVFNLGLVIGTAFAIRPGPVPGFVITQDVPILAAVTVLVGVLILKYERLGRRSAGLMLGVFAAYMAFVALRGGG